MLSKEDYIGRKFKYHPSYAAHENVFEILKVSEIFAGKITMEFKIVKTDGHRGDVWLKHLKHIFKEEQPLEKMLFLDEHPEIEQSLPYRHIVRKIHHMQQRRKEQGYAF
jgi:hypothetical protein